MTDLPTRLAAQVALYAQKTEGYEVLFHDASGLVDPPFDSTAAELAREDAAWSSDHDADLAADREHAKRSARWERHGEGRW